MYCAHCGVKLADTEKRCPLCGTEADEEELLDGYMLRRWGSNEWIEPAYDVYAEDCTMQGSWLGVGEQT